MILSGASILRREIVRDMVSAAHTVQPCGVDLSLCRVLKWSSRARIDLDNSQRQAAKTYRHHFVHSCISDAAAINLDKGAYLIEFNESVRMPLDCMGQIFVRSSLWRSGAVIMAGVVDPGYKGVLGALLEVKNRCGITLCKDAKLAQLVVHQLEGEVEGYRGVYQSSSSISGRDGS